MVKKNFYSHFNRCLYLFFLGALVNFLSIYASEQALCNEKNELKKFAKKFAPPADIIKAIEETPQWPHIDFIQSKANNPSIYIKSNQIDRIINAYRMKKCFALYNLHCLSVADKYFYDGFVISKAIEIDTHKTIQHISDTEIKQLKKFQKQMGYMDVHHGNIKRNKNTGKLTFIDTEDRSFAGSAYWSDKSEQECIKVLYSSLYSSISVKSRKSLKKGHKKINSKQSSTKKNFLVESKRFDSCDIDFEKVKQEFKQ
jgi:hypothetical protein